MISITKLYGRPLSFLKKKRKKIQFIYLFSLSKSLIDLAIRSLFTPKQFIIRSVDMQSKDSYATLAKIMGFTHVKDVDSFSFYLVVNKKKLTDETTCFIK